jgi:uncharacterized RDD family membrane protein YckC
VAFRNCAEEPPIWSTATENRESFDALMRYAGFWRRLGAHLIDFSLADLALPLLVETLVFGAMYGVYYVVAHLNHSTIKPYDSAFNPVLEQVVSVIVGLVIAVPYYTWLTYRYGATPGKKPFKIVVVNAADGGPITLKQSALRCVGYVASYATFGAGFFMVAFHPQKRALHDLIAGTASVIKEA